MNDHLAYVSDNRSVRNPILQVLAEKWYTILYLWYAIIGIFIELEHSPEGDKRPVVLVPGLLGRTLSWEPMLKHLAANGHPVYTVPLGFQLGNIRKKSKILETFLIEKNIKDCYIVGHSMGGLIASGLTYKGRDRVKKIFLAGTPVRGTYLSYFLPMFVCSWQMMPNSKFIREVGEVLGKLPNVQSVFTKKDQIILPSENSRLGHFDDVELPEAGHLNLFMGPLGIECLFDLITAEEKKDPKPIIRKVESIKQRPEELFAEKTSPKTSPSTHKIKTIPKTTSFSKPTKSKSVSKKKRILTKKKKRK
ncbi:alpha/beta fold hydrolase [Leptospira santarosai]|uniref:esterase/lipase family protein n=1 Tax=Leptospira santarosai TaxID=28183 RepID=UPI000774E5E5|nr:alpha/beta fold hydrolase [Leptospira santarosai]MDI7185824.1 alpha/beta fold hydrolase [Leptospira santarosai]MDI7197361.1 alpha/beta fold hydrolase [Leptospira santarosai]MDI7201373.1 alpha/beta fold hydrolase [Leptospira santarosai]